MSAAVAIRGLACRYPEADDPDGLWDVAWTGRRCFRPLPASRLDLAAYDAGRVGLADSITPVQCGLLADYRFERARYRIPETSYTASDFAHWLALDMAGRALADAGVPDADGLDRGRTAVIVGNTLTGEFSRADTLRMRLPYAQAALASALTAAGTPDHLGREIARAFAEAFRAPLQAPNEESLAGALSNTIAGRIANQFDLHGGAYTVDGACASGLLAVHNACLLLRGGEVDAVLVGAVDLSLDPFELVGFSRNGALASEEMRVFDRRAAGFWPGEGAGFALVTRADAPAGAPGPALARILGTGLSTDGRGGLTRPSHDGQLRALRRAYARAGVAPGSVGYIEAHGTGTAVGDPVEVRALADLLADAERPVPIGSIKANIGHTKAAAGFAGLIKAVQALRNAAVPPHVGCAEPHPVFAECGQRVRPAVARAWDAPGPRRAGVSAFGFGGVNAHVVLDAPESAPAPALGPPPRAHDDAELLLFAAADEASLADALRDARALADWLSRAELGDYAAWLAGRAARGPWRAAIVARHGRRMGELADRLLAHLERGDGRPLIAPEDGVALAHAARPLRIGLLMPGQAAPARLDAGAWSGLVPGAAARVAGLPPVSGTSDSDTAVAQPAIVAGSLSGLELLARLGIEGHAALGHSLGELTALHWARVWPAETTLALAAKRGRVMADRCTPGGVMARLELPAERARVWAADAGAVLACHNAPAESVVAGGEPAVEAVLTRARREGVPATRLSVSHAFHSPDMRPAEAPFARVVRELGGDVPARAVASSVTGDWLADGFDLADHLVRQLRAPVAFHDALTRLAGSVDLLIEVGPGSGLTRLARATTDIPAAALDAHGSTLAPALAAVGAAHALGAEVAADVLFEGRRVRAFDPTRRPTFLTNPCGRPDGGPAAPATPSAPPPDAVTGLEPMPGRADSALDALIACTAAATGMAPESLAAEQRFLDDLHLSSIAAARVVAAAAGTLGIAGLEGATEFANLSLAETAEALDELRAHAGPDAHDVGSPAAGADAPADPWPAGVAPWVRGYRKRWSALDDAPASPHRPPWRRLARDGAPLAGDAAVADGAAHGRLIDLRGVPDSEVMEIVAALGTHGTADGVVELALLHDGQPIQGLARGFFLESRLAALRLIEAGDRPTDDPSVSALLARPVRGVAEHRLAADGTAWAAYLRPVPLDDPADRAGAAGAPLDDSDVVLVTGGAAGIGAECALALAEAHGARLVLVGRSAGNAPPVVATLGRLNDAGVSAIYLAADVRDRAAVEAAVADAEARLGPITAVVHAAGVNTPTPFQRLDRATMADALAAKVDGLDHVLDALAGRTLRLLVGFGSIIAEIGLAGEAHYAYANARLAARVRDYAAANPACRCHAVAWSVWSGTGMGERLGTLERLRRQGVDALSVDQALTAFHALLRTHRGEDPVTVVTSRFGPPASVSLGPAPLPNLRFLEQVRVHYPEVEIVADSRLSRGGDPYLDDHVLDGLPVLPGVLGLEALAQAAAALAGAGIAEISDVAFERAVVLPADGRLTVRVAALVRPDGSVDATLRAADDGFASVCMRATFAASRTPMPARPADTAGATPAGRALAADALYAGLFFQAGRFRRVGAIAGLSARGVHARLSEPVAEPLFGAYQPRATLLGDPAARDAGLHVLQATHPLARLIPVRAARIVRATAPDGAEAPPAVAVRAVELWADSAEYAFDIAFLEAGGACVEVWHEAVFRAVGQRPADGLAAPLRGVALERRMGDLLGVPELRVAVATGATRAQARAAALNQLDADTRAVHRGDGRPLARPGEGDLSVSHAGPHCAVARAPGRVGIDLEPVAERTPEDWARLLAPVDLALARRLAERLRAPFDAAATRVWATREALRKLGVPRAAPLAIARLDGAGWVRLAADRTVVATGPTDLGDGQDAIAALAWPGADTATHPTGEAARSAVVET